MPCDVEKLVITWLCAKVTYRIGNLHSVLKLSFDGI